MYRQRSTPFSVTLLKVFGVTLIGLTFAISLAFSVVWQENVNLRQVNVDLSQENTSLRQEINDLKNTEAYQTIQALNQTVIKLRDSNTALAEKNGQLKEENARLRGELDKAKLSHVTLSGSASAVGDEPTSIAFTVVSEEQRGARFSVPVIDGNYEIELPNHRQYSVVLEIPYWPTKPSAVCRNWPFTMKDGSYYLDSYKDSVSDIDWEEGS